MEISYWKSRWQKNNTGWHMQQVYPPLKKIWQNLSVRSFSNVLIPLCGKSLDMKWLAQQGAQIVGVEVSSKALKEFMDSCSGAFSNDSSHGFSVYRSDKIELWQGDFLKFPASEIVAPDLIYDKAAIVALPEEMRAPYVKKMMEISGEATQILLQTFEYKQEEMNGPPFSVDEDELWNRFGKQFDIELLHEQSKFDELEGFRRRGLSSYLKEKVWLLAPD